MLVANPTPMQRPVESSCTTRGGPTGLMGFQEVREIGKTKRGGERDSMLELAQRDSWANNITKSLSRWLQNSLLRNRLAKCPKVRSLSLPCASLYRLGCDRPANGWRTAPSIFDGRNV